MFNIIVDPYGYFQLVEIEGFNKNKSDVPSEYATKFYYAKRAKPDTIMLGTSRMLVFHPELVNKYTNNKVYNLALSGSNVYEQFQYFKYMVTHYPIKNVILSLDLFSFNPDNKNKVGFSEDRFKYGFLLKDYIEGVFLLDTLRASILTVTNNVMHECVPVNYHEGFSTWCSKEKAYKQIGKDMTVRDMKNSLKLFYTDKGAYNSEALKHYDGVHQKVQFLREIVDICKQMNIRLSLYISPVYQAQFDLIYAMELGSTYERWKEDIAEIHDYFDFTGLNAVTTNSDLWWDSSHLKNTGGEFIFARIFNKDAASEQIPTDFGVLVTKSNIKQHNSALHNHTTQHTDTENILNLNYYKDDLMRQ